MALSYNIDMVVLGFSASMDRAGRIVVQVKQVWCFLFYCIIMSDLNFLPIFLI